MQSIAIRKSFVIGQILRRHMLLILLVGAYSALAFWVSSKYPVNVSEAKVGALFRSYVDNVPMMVFFILFWRLIDLTYFKRSPDRFGELKTEVKGFLGQRDRLASGLLTMVVMTLMLMSFAQLKNLIPQINAFSWDVFFMELDKTIHFGRLPHEWAHAVFGADFLIATFTGLYNLWLFLMYFSLLVACFMRPESLPRMQYLIGFLLTWAIGGNLVATIFSSAGPVYYANLGLGDAYVTLTERLKEHAATGGLTVVETQHLLWYMYTSDLQISAISAFPSMHVGSSVLMALFALSVSRVLGYVLIGFAAMIMIGSVLLAWHYAVDGYAGALIALASWKLAGWLARTPLGGLGTARQA
jgi:membrane-associated phospholipid phosphatase